MNQNTLSKKLGARDFIHIGIFTVIFIVFFMACVMVMSLSIYSQPFGVALAAFVSASIYLLLRTKVPKAGAISLFGVLFALVMFVMGSGWPIPTSVIVSTLIAEFVARTGNYQNYVRESIGYAIFMLGTAIGSYLPLLIMKDYYLKISEGNNVDQEFMSRLLDFINGPYLALALLTTVLTSALGAVLARSIFRKHFAKTGLLREQD